MVKVRLVNGGIYMITPELWERYSIPKSQDMLKDFCRWCRENEQLMDSGGRITSKLVRKEWTEKLALRIKESSSYSKCASK